jgi:hypothetical protein
MSSITSSTSRSNCLPTHVFNHVLRDLPDFRGEKLVLPGFPRRFVYTRKFKIFIFLNKNKYLETCNLAFFHSIFNILSLWKLLRSSWSSHCLTRTLHWHVQLKDFYKLFVISSWNLKTLETWNIYWPNNNSTLFNAVIWKRFPCDSNVLSEWSNNSFSRSKHLRIRG